MALIQHKQKWRKLLAEHQHIQRQTQTAMCFAAWKCSLHGGMPFDQISEFDCMLKDQDKDVAISLHSFRSIGRQVTTAIRQDDVNIFANLTQEVSEFLGPHQTREFWKVLRRSLPKFRDRRMGQDPHKLEILHDQWEPYFMQLESGTQKAPINIVADCHNRQLAADIVQTHFSITDLPSVLELEDALRETHAEKATGLDPLPSGIFREWATEIATVYFPLLLKICMWQHEPVASEGGEIAVIYKRGTGLQASDYRGIMLLPSLAKRTYAMLRTRLMSLLSTTKPQGQLGGFPAMQVPFGSQLLQTFGRLMDAMDVSSAIVFLDSSNAFHRLVRELVSGVSVPQDLDMIELLQLPCLLQRLNAPPFLIQLIKDLRTDTWMYVPGAKIPLVTKKGTRPGSPLADCIFHILMADITGDLNRIVAANEPFQQILSRADLHVESVIWADDVAIPVATEEARDLPAAIETILVAAHKIFSRRGFTLNMKKGRQVLLPHSEAQGHH